MQVLSTLSDTTLRQTRGILTDIDDTLTERGRLHADVLAALEALQAAGVPVIPVTGRPFGWAYPQLRLWPIRAIVAENGAAFTWLDKDDRQHIRYYADAATLAAHRSKLNAVMHDILQTISEASLTLDHFLRVGDVAFDLCENVPQKSRDTIDAMTEKLRTAGCHVAESTIHLHGSFGDYDKCAASLRLLEEIYGIPPEEARQTWLFIGDSLNDAPLFAGFEHTIGVANVARFVARMPVPPKYVTDGAAGRGFWELAQRVLAARAAR